MTRRMLPSARESRGAAPPPTTVYRVPCGCATESARERQRDNNINHNKLFQNYMHYNGRWPGWAMGARADCADIAIYAKYTGLER